MSQNVTAQTSKASSPSLRLSPTSAAGSASNESEPNKQGSPSLSDASDRASQQQTAGAPTDGIYHSPHSRAGSAADQQQAAAASAAVKAAAKAAAASVKSLDYHATKFVPASQKTGKDTKEAYPSTEDVRASIQGASQRIPHNNHDQGQDGRSDGSSHSVESSQSSGSGSFFHAGAKHASPQSIQLSHSVDDPTVIHRGTSLKRGGSESRPHDEFDTLQYIQPPQWSSNFGQTAAALQDRSANSSVHANAVGTKEDESADQSSSLSLLPSQMQELLVQHWAKRPTPSANTPATASDHTLESGSGSAASQWAPGGAFASGTGDSAQRSVVTGATSTRYTGGASAFVSRTSTPSPMPSITAGATFPHSGLSSTSSGSIPILETMRVSAALSGSSLQQALPFPYNLSTAQYQQAMQVPSPYLSRGGAGSGANQGSGPSSAAHLYQLQLQHAAMKNAYGMPLPQSSGPLARMQALSSVLGTTPTTLPSPATSSQSQSPAHALLQGPAQSLLGSGTSRFPPSTYTSAHSAQIVPAPYQAAGISQGYSNPGSAAGSGYGLGGSSTSQPQLALLDWSNLAKSTSSSPYSTTASYRSAGASQTPLSLPTTPGIGSQVTAASIAPTTMENNAASVGVGLNLPGGVEGLAIKQPWLSTAPSNAATAARLAGLGIGIGPGVNPHSDGTAGADRQKTGQQGVASSTNDVNSNPPIVNTGNSGPMCVQPGDWVCSSCGFVNWRRRRVCLRCYPFAEGNETAASLANGAILAAQLAAGVSPSKIDTASLLKSPVRAREARAKEQQQQQQLGVGVGTSGSASSSMGPNVGLGLTLGPGPNIGMTSSGTSLYGSGQASSARTSPTMMLNPFGTDSMRSSPMLASASTAEVPNWAALSQADKVPFDEANLAQLHYTQEWQQRRGPNGGRSTSGPLLGASGQAGASLGASNAPGGPHLRQASYTSGLSFTSNEGLGSGPAQGSSWHPTPSSASAGSMYTPPSQAASNVSTTRTSAASSATSLGTRNIWGASPPRKIGGNKLIDEDDTEVSVAGGSGACGPIGREANTSSDAPTSGAWKPKPIGSRNPASTSDASDPSESKGKEADAGL
ncbi:hypothetical protein OC846_003998 [Tilletia horrida]|uniref:RanBP2-type domain-containing protein n=1 Tax=Tilletia horrida TaxID=155126 RepID=A0AAN6JR72_9BASI|nr:hypothetical protein OC845_005102 [Tilletia horrida]KAK0549579.1 hypothetical protein OC846_003998 [Tilletia horrida]KAK0559376.1 hypothetical protein OC861_006664 [Tilletia horrida]